MKPFRHWSLGTKLALVAAPFVVLSGVVIALTLGVSWQLDGGAAALNEAGRMRMQTYRLSLPIAAGDTARIGRDVETFAHSLALLREGDPQRPLFVPWDGDVRARFARVEREWQDFRTRWTDSPRLYTGALATDTAAFVATIDAFVSAIERHISRWTALLHLLQMAMIAIAIIGAVVLLYAGYLFVLEPVGQLKQAIERIDGGDFDARVTRGSDDEFGTLADGFNGMAEHLQQLYRSLEARVAEKTAQLQEKHERLEALYDVTAMVADATMPESLAHAFVARVRRVVRADGVALRWADAKHHRYVMLAAEGLPDALREREQCIVTGACHCGATSAGADIRVVALRRGPAPPPCTIAGFNTVVTVPIRHHDRPVGELDLLFHADYVLSEPERSLLEALVAHLASGLDSLRLNALAKEAAVSQERTFLARELHDSIAQSLAFLKIQVQLMREAVAGGDSREIAHVLDEIDTGVRESYGDVRELLVHFRTRPEDEDIGSALQTTLRKFEHQSGLPGTLEMHSHGLPLAPDVQVQVLHIVQEALSNVRKHAHASHVWVDVRRQPDWRIEVRDDGIGFDGDTSMPDETHVGLRIMQERAERIGARVEVLSTRGRGSSVILTLPASSTLRQEVVH
ncbi:MAG: type IV pili methyl-accepting chemotaxis transducer N-terminal domain-containing protein [Gammaproteobacteria bacterium]